MGIGRSSEILLESGTNELELMEFTVADQTFGINVAKVREIMKITPVRNMQNAHPVIEGIFKPRDQVITVLNLASYLNLPDSDLSERDIFMVTEFNGQNIAFHVHSVLGIVRVSWQDIQKPDQVIYGGEEGVATGIVEHDSRLITILDFEKIIAEIAPSASIRVSDIDAMGKRERNDKPIVVAEDSMMLGRMIIEALRRAGYVNIYKADDGQQAYDRLQDLKNAGGDIKSKAACLITDIEMPRMDGHRLLKLVKEDPVLREIPVVLFSSLINQEMRLKGEQLGANAQISKPEITSLVQVVDSLTGVGQ